MNPEIKILMKDQTFPYEYDCVFKHALLWLSREISNVYGSAYLNRCAIKYLTEYTVFSISLRYEYLFC